MEDPRGWLRVRARLRFQLRRAAEPLGLGGLGVGDTALRARNRGSGFVSAYGSSYAGRFCLWQNRRPNGSKEVFVVRETSK